MKNYRLPVTWLVVLLALVATFPLLAQAGQIPLNTTLSDQFGTESSIGQLAASRTVVVVYSAEREAGDYLKAWHQGLNTQLPADTVLLAVAKLKPRAEAWTPIQGS
jgi:hypothetical protein